MLTIGKREQINTSAPMGFVAQMGTELDKTKNVIKCVYDFSVSGGAIGDISLKDVAGSDAIVPSGAIITKVLVHVVTAATSSGAATVALKSEGAADLLGATAVASLSLAAKLDGVPANTAATAIILTADRTIKATVAAFALTAGKIHVFVEYVLSV